MQFMMLIPNIMFILHENQVPTVKPRNTSAICTHFATDVEKIDFLDEEKELIKTTRILLKLSI